MSRCHMRRPPGHIARLYHSQSRQSPAPPVASPTSRMTSPSHQPPMLHRAPYSARNSSSRTLRAAPSTLWRKLVYRRKLPGLYRKP
eukprot:scaffold323052_cov33-Tisochrysis_lutea.AAC.2